MKEQQQKQADGGGGGLQGAEAEGEQGTELEGGRQGGEASDKSIFFYWSIKVFCFIGRSN